MHTILTGDKGHSAETDVGKTARALACSCVVQQKEAGVVVHLGAPGVPRQALVHMQADAVSVRISVLRSRGRRGQALELLQQQVEEDTTLVTSDHSEALSSLTKASQSMHISKLKESLLRALVADLLKPLQH